MGCLNGVHLRLAPLLSPGRYLLALTADGKAHRCSVELSALGQWQNGSRCDFLEFFGTVSVTYLGTPKTLDVKLRTATRRLAFVRVVPRYGLDYPNGKELTQADREKLWEALAALARRLEFVQARKMSPTRLAPVFVALVLLVQTEARADVPPPDACNVAGQRCATAPPDYQTQGTCTASKCQKTLPVGDGAVRTHEYDCTLCVAGSGSGGAANTGGAANVGGAAGSKGDTGSKEDSGCAVRPSHAGPAVSGLMLLAGALALLGGRRSRRG